MATLFRIPSVHGVTRATAKQQMLKQLICTDAPEQALRYHGYRQIAGVDEVGRGALFGPVVAAAVILPNKPHIMATLSRMGLKDSKQMTREDRERLDRKIRGIALAVSVAEIDAATIDRINIYQASRLAMLLAVEQLPVTPDHLIIDALRIDHPCPQTKLFYGDALCLSIAAASVVAKVHRDALMRALDREHPQYGLAAHKGYATPEHREALRRHGPCALHRRSFAPVAASDPDAALEARIESGDLFLDDAIYDDDALQDAAQAAHMPETSVLGLRLLCVIAHPDDECFAFGGALALAAERNVETTILCLTEGTAGSYRGTARSDAELGQLRRAEFAASCEILGVHHHEFLGDPDLYQDGKVAFAPLAEVAGKLVARMRALRPHVVITFGMDGGLNTHADHTAVSAATTAAFHWSGSPKRYKEAGELYTPQRLFHLTADFFLPERLRPIPAPWTLTLDIRSVFERKQAAFAAHTTQAPLMEQTRPVFEQYGQCGAVPARGLHYAASGYAVH